MIRKHGSKLVTRAIPAKRLVGSKTKKFRRPYPQTGRDASLRLLPFTLMIFLGYLTVGIPLSVLPSHIHYDLHFGPLVAGIVIAAQSIATLATRQYGGYLADARGARLTLLIGVAGCVFAALLYAASEAVGSPLSSVITILLARLILGWGESLYVTGALAWCLGSVGSHHTGRSMVWVGIAMFAAVGCGAPLGSFVNDRWGFLGMASAAGLAPLLALVLASMMESIPTEEGNRLPFVAIVRSIGRYGLAISFCSLGFGTLYAFLGLLFRSHSWPDGAAGLSAFALGFILVRIFWGGLPDRVGGLRVASITIPLQAAALAVLALATTPTIATAATFMVGCAYSLTFPAIGVTAMQSIPRQNRGAAMGALMGFVDIGLGLAGPIGGAAGQIWGYTATFGVASMMACVAVVLLLTAPKRRSGLSEPQPKDSTGS